MGLLDEVFAKKKEPARIRPVKNTPTKKVPDKSSRTTTTEKSASQPSGSSIFDSLKRVHGALSPSSKHRSTQKQDVKKSKTSTEIKTVDKDRDKDKIKDRDKIKSKEKEKDTGEGKRTWFRSPSKSNLRKEPIKSSTSSLNVGAGAQKVTSSGVDPKKKRPATGVFSDANVTFRKGQNTKIDGQTIGDNLSRASSVTNLDAEPKVAKGAKPRKSSSRDRIDKIGESRKNDKKGITRNNNQLDSGENPYHSVDSLSEEELLHLRKQLQEMAQEKTNLALQLGEQKGQLNILQKEIQKLKEESNIQLEHLTEENTALRNRLRDVAHSPLSDNEKQQLLFDSHRHHSSAPASIATNIIDDNNGADTTCTTPDWDKHSSSNVSEVSVACLQDKINQMQETHYSTNEELQATLQELTDLQRQLTELQQENERLNEEKTLMFDSLCRQTERLNDSRSEVESLKQLLYQEKDDTGQFETAVEREQKLVDLLKSAQEEREGLLVKLEQLNNELQEARSGIIDKDEQIGQLRDRVRTLECTLDAKHAEHKLLDQELAQAKDQCSGKQIEINRLTDLLDNARTKINELEQDRALSDKSELDELLDNARKEKDTLESEVAHLKEQLAISKNEIEKLREQVSILQEECKVTRNNAKTTQSDLEYKCEKLVKEKNGLNEQLQEFQEALNEVQVQSQCQLEDKRQLSAVLSETQRNLSEAERKNIILESEVDELKKQRAEENEEWEKFQDDLLTSVRVANDFKTEAQQELQRMILENKQYRDRERQLKAEIDKLKGGTLDSTDKENLEMDLLVKRPNRRGRERPRQNSGNASSSSKSDKTTPPPSQANTVRRRENRSLKAKRLKTLSVEEEMLLKSLNSYHADIDKTIPDEFLTEEQKVIRKLKIIYEDDYLKVKPVAPKPKNQLAISKPLLDSVLTNPKLMAILKNPKVKTIEDMASFEKEAPEIRNIIRDIDRAARGKSEEFTRSEKRISLVGRSMSMDQVHEMENLNKNLRLYRTVETEDLTEENSPTIEHRVSSLVPSDSVSNFNKRYSDFSLVVKETIPENIFNQNVKYSTLERIVKTIPKNVPESKLSHEQRFAVKLLAALEERKNTLKKNDKAKSLPISKPTEESVLRNPKLKEIIYDPDIKEVRRKSESYAFTPIVEETLRPYKSYDNIMFTFDEKRRRVNMYNTPSETSSDTFSSAEFNVDASEVGPYESFSGPWRPPPPTPKPPRNVEFITFSKQSSVEQKETASPRPNSVEVLVTIHKVSSDNEMNKPGATKMTEVEMDKRKTKERSPDLDSLVYNDTIKKNPKEIKKDVKYVVKVSSDKEINKPDFTKMAELEVNKRKTKERSPDLDSLVYNDTIKKKPKDIKAEELKVDLLQDKIKKLTNREKLEQTSKKNMLEAETSTDNYHEIDNNVIYPPPLHFATVETVDIAPIESYNSLEYNDTFKRPIQRGKSFSENETDQTAAVTDTDETIKNITEKFNTIHKLIQEDKRFMDKSIEKELGKDDIGNMEESVVLRDKSDVHKNTVEYVTGPEVSNSTEIEQISDDILDGRPPQSPYDYRDILKENRFGVTSPLNYRMSYKDVVKEIKNRFSVNEQEFSSNKKSSDEADHGSRPVSEEIQVRRSKSSIDKEMEHIFEHYLKTRVSQIIKQTESKPQSDPELQVEASMVTSTPIEKSVEADLEEPQTLEIKRISLLSRSYNSSENIANSETEDHCSSSYGLQTPEANKSNESEIFDYSKLSPKELTFSDDSYFELKDGSAKRIVAFEDSVQTKESVERAQDSDTKNIAIEENAAQVVVVRDNNTVQPIEISEQIAKAVHDETKEPVEYTQDNSTNNIAIEENAAQIAIVTDNDTVQAIKISEQVAKAVHDETKEPAECIQDNTTKDIAIEENAAQIAIVTDNNTVQPIEIIEQITKADENDGLTNVGTVEDQEKVTSNLEAQTVKHTEPERNIRGSSSNALNTNVSTSSVSEDIVAEDDSVGQFAELVENVPDIINIIQEHPRRQHDSYEGQKESFDPQTCDTTPTNEVIVDDIDKNKDKASSPIYTITDIKYIKPLVANFILNDVQTATLSLESSNTSSADNQHGEIREEIDNKISPIPDFKITPGEDLPHPPDQFELTDEELNIIRRAKKQAVSRPVSGLNDQDLELIQSLSLTYLGNESVHTYNNDADNDQVTTEVDKAKQSPEIVEDDNELLKTTEDKVHPLISDTSHDDNKVIYTLSSGTVTVEPVIPKNLPKERSSVDADPQENLGSKSNASSLFEYDKTSVHKSKTLPIFKPDAADDLEAFLGTISTSRTGHGPNDQLRIKPDSSNQLKKDKIVPRKSKALPTSNPEAADDLEALLGAISTSRVVKGHKEKTPLKPGLRTRHLSPSKEDKLSPSKPEAFPVTKTNAADDLEALLGTISISRNKAPKKTLDKTGTNKASLENIDETVKMDIPSSDKKVPTQVAATKMIDSLNEVNDTVKDKTDLGKHRIIVDGSTDSGTNRVKLELINTEATKNPLDFDKPQIVTVQVDQDVNIENANTCAGIQANQEMDQNIQPISQKVVPGGDGETYNDEVKYLSETSGVLEPNQFKNVITESGTIKKRTERHTILLRNQHLDRKEVKSLSLEKDGDISSNNVSQRVRSRPKSDNLTDKRVKSFAQHFERLSKERPKKEPIYANINVLKNQRFMMSRHAESIEKKPLPVPRSRNHGSKDFDSLGDRRSTDSHEVMKNMSEHKNFSETKNPFVEEEVASSLATVLKVKGLPITTQVSSESSTQEKQESQSHVVTVSAKDEDNTEPAEVTKVETENQEETTEKPQLLSSVEKAQLWSSMEKPQDQREDSGEASSSYSVIAVTSTPEKLDLRIPSETQMHPIHESDASTLNLFNLEGIDSASIDGTDVGLYRSTTQEMNKKIGYDVTYLGELSDTDSYEDPKFLLKGDSQSKPKIIDFVPLDYATKSMFPNSSNIPEYQTLEREKVYHVLNSAPKSTVSKADIKQVDDVDDKPKNTNPFVEPEPNKSPEGATKLEGSIGQERSKSATDLNALPAKSQTKIDIQKRNIPLGSTSRSRSKIDLPKEIRNSTFSAAKKIFQELEAKNSPKHSSKDSETMRSSVNVPYLEKSEVSSSVHSSNKDELSPEEINEEI
ncbi:centromere-associated protein E isoform X3 [Diabrotica virgifera virgifera]|uniref:Centromere-associated protein E-like n=1 Tax=Diabrotica virgifera virgifera TaxID=50390 RepID=A0ABM5KMQ2_DIAVI|nr:centromere-associated protein E isoform X3 [Diabrotica virgifera virgifera]